MFTHRKPLVRLLLAGGIAALLAVFVWRFLPASQPLELKFLGYTNDAVGTRIALLEITNHSDSAYEWRLHTDARGWDFAPAVTHLAERDEPLRNVTVGAGGLNLFEHDFLRIATDAVQSGARLSLEIKHYPRTGWEKQRYGFARTLDRFRLYYLAGQLRSGKRVNGPALP